MKPTRTNFPFGLGSAGVLTAALIAALLAAAPAQAQSVSLVFDQPAQSVIPGSPVTFSGSIVNTSGVAESLNGFSFGQLGPDFGVVGLTADVMPFFNLTPFTLGAGASTGDIALFTMTADSSVTPGSYANTFNILGGRISRRVPRSAGRSSPSRPLPRCRRRPRPPHWACSCWARRRLRSRRVADLPPREAGAGHDKEGAGPERSGPAPFFHAAL